MLFFCRKISLESCNCRTSPKITRTFSHFMRVMILKRIPLVGHSVRTCPPVLFWLGLSGRNSLEKFMETFSETAKKSVITSEKIPSRVRLGMPQALSFFECHLRLPANSRPPQYGWGCFFCQILVPDEGSCSCEFPAVLGVFLN